MTRLRTKDLRYTPASNHYAEEWSTPNCGIPPAWKVYYNQPVELMCGSYAHMVDDVIPGYRRRSKAEGEVFFNPAHRVSVTIDAGTGTFGGLFQNKSAACSGTSLYYPQYRFSLPGGASYGRLLSGFLFSLIGSQVIPPVSLFSNEDRRSMAIEASTACLNSRGRGPTNMWEALAELHKSATMLTEILDKLSKALVRLVSLKGKSGLNNASGAYLIWRYGIMPLKKDIEALLAAFQKEGGLKRITSRGTAIDTRSAVSQRSGQLYATLNWTGELKTTETMTYRATSLDSAYIDFHDNVGLALKGLITLPWELLTYSFVLDWFLNIGDLLGALVPTYGMQQLGSCVTERRSVKVTFSTLGFTPYNHLTMVLPPHPAQCNLLCDAWTRVNQLSSPDLVLRTSFKFDKWYRVLDALSLITQRLTR